LAVFYLVGLTGMIGSTAFLLSLDGSRPFQTVSLRRVGWLAGDVRRGSAPNDHHIHPGATNGPFRGRGVGTTSCSFTEERTS